MSDQTERPLTPIGIAVALAQGLRARGRIERLPAAGGPAAGTVAGSSGRTLRIAVVGESTAAGVGVATQQDGFTAALARRLAATTGASVDWRVAGQDGATARRIRHRLVPLLGPGPFDVVVVLAGANDVLSRRPPEQWREDLAAIVDGLATISHRVVVAGTPPFAVFPSLPPTLGRYLAERGRRLDAVTRELCGSIAHAQFVGTDPSLIDPAFFARDGFHPGAGGYERWAELVAGELQLSSSQPA
ncbi:SGNH/GDSL hydrolase family protein [Microbacterium jejuense]|uniref:SGNH/GDSL hydrolase family protein n=1 Tax=Microbacterium jejuense TaxID=1263637 RepID=UPI0031ED3842